MWWLACLQGAAALGSPPPADARAASPASSRFWRGKRVFLAGASSGLGEAVAEELSARGASLVIGARRTEALARVAAACAARSGGDPPRVLGLDVCAPRAELEAKACEAAALLGGGVDVLCYCAGRGQRTRAAETSAEAHALLMATNFEGAVTLSRAVLPAMLERGEGHLCVVSSVQGFFGQPGRTSYAASKAAMIGYFDGLRAEVASSGVRVTVVSPGYIATDHAASAVGSDGTADENSKKGMLPGVLAERIADAVERGEPELIASQLDGRVAIWLRVLWPSVLFKLMEKKSS
ncbi:hypothetical protein AB1Y20_018683 [Prymnesium parvum]|uniref:Ketoreductase domain-containing protein n=1 Tax=Prymnesium parvum TaxID=97485 RepID=A0AB34JSH3_PRYPA